MKKLVLSIIILLILAIPAKSQRKNGFETNGLDLINKRAFGVLLSLGCCVESNKQKVIDWRDGVDSPFFRFPELAISFRF